MPNDDDLDGWETVTDVPLSRKHDWLCVVLMNQSGTRFLAWGVIQVAPFLLHAREGLKSERQTIERLHYQQCILSPKKPPPSLHVNYGEPAVMPGRCFNLDELSEMLTRRLEQYKNPTRKCIVSTPEGKALDRLSFQIAAAAVARYRGLHPPGAEHSSLEHWIRGEQRIALHRFRMDHVRELEGYRVFEDDDENMEDATSPEEKLRKVVRGLGGPPILNVTDLLPLAHQDEVAIAYDGHFLVYPDHAVVLLPRLLREGEETLRHIAQIGTFQSFRDHPHLMDMLETFHSQLRDWDAPAVLPTPKPKRQITLNGGAPILPSADLDELKAVMPACMRPLYDRAFRPGIPHLKFDDRRIFYGFVLANGVPAAMLEKEIVAKASMIEGYDYKPIIVQIKETDKYVRTEKFGMGFGCNKLQDMGHCPWYHSPSSIDDSATRQARSDARVSCHQHQLNTAKLQVDPRGKEWKIGFPLAFTQDLKHMLLDKA